MSDKRISQKLKLVALATGGAVLIGLVSKAVGLGQEATSVVAGAALGLLVGFGTPYAFDMRGHAAKLKTVNKTAVLPDFVPDAAGSVATALGATPTTNDWATAVRALQQDSFDRDLGRWEIVLEKDGHRRERVVLRSLLDEPQEPVPARPDTLPEDDASVHRLHPGPSGAWPGIGGFVVPEQTMTPQLA
jgi:hypothetical protein